MFDINLVYSYLSFELDGILARFRPLNRLRIQEEFREVAVVLIKYPFLQR